MDLQWLHYVSLKLLKSKRLRAPNSRRTNNQPPPIGFTERECYECLVDVQQVLAQRLETKTGKKGRRKTLANKKCPTLEGACDVMKYGAANNWVSYYNTT